MALPPWYKWVILTASSISTFASYGYIAGNTSIATIFYIQHYNERTISGLISPAQYSLLKISCKFFLKLFISFLLCFLYTILHIMQVA